MKARLVLKVPQPILLMCTFFTLLFMISSCDNTEVESNKEEPVANKERKIGVFLVNHGSRSENWRNTLKGLEENVKDKILADGTIKGTKTAFMEYTEPSIATRAKEFDKEGYTDLITVPIFLTVSPHTFEDIPTILGQKEDPAAREALKMEKIDRYKPDANVYITPKLDFTDILKENILRRAKALSEDPENEGLVLIGYGDVDYEKEWDALFEEVGKYVEEKTGINVFSHGWCGHIVHYDPQKTTDAIKTVLEKKKKAVVVPVLVAMDEEFQKRIIPEGIKKIKNHEERVAYIPDAILPDKNVQQWVIDITKEYADKIKEKEEQ